MTTHGYAIKLKDDVSPAAKAASAALHDLGGGLEHSKSAIETLTSGFIKVVEPAEVMRHSIEGVSGGLKEMATSLASGDVKGLVEGAAEAFAGLASTLDLVVPGLGQAASAIIKFGGAVGGTLVEIAEEGVKTALEVGEANERLTATFEALGDKPGQGQKTLDFLNKLSSELPQGREQLAKWTREFEAFGVTDLGELRSQIRATAAAQAILGDEGAAAYTKLAEKIQDAVQGHHALKMGKDPLKMIAESGVSAATVAAQMGLTLQQLDQQLKGGTIDAGKFGKALQTSLISEGKGPLDAMGNSLASLKTKGMEILGHLFDGIDLSPITNAIKSVIDLGSQGEPSGQQLKKGIGSGIQGIITWLGKMVTEGEIVFLELELYAVQHRKQLKQVEAGFHMVGDAILSVAHAVEKVIGLTNTPPSKWLSFLMSGGGQGGAAGGPNTGVAPPHATGGLVMRPAPGELFASVAPGEAIIPTAITNLLRKGIHGHIGGRIGGEGLHAGVHGARAGVGFHDSLSRELMGPMRELRSVLGPGLGSAGRTMMSQPANENGKKVEIGTLHLTIQAQGGVTDATSLSVTGLTLALERMQLASGR